jgi:hypothetical protein
MPQGPDAWVTWTLSFSLAAEAGRPAPTEFVT